MDTIIIKLHGHFKTGDKTIFVPELIKRTLPDLSPTERASTRRYLRHFRLETKQGEEYTPRIEIFETLNKDRKALLYVMQIQFSAPKLLYWNSLQEIGENDKDKVVSTLKSSLARLNIFAETETLENALVVGVHACKNIPLPKSMSVREILNELTKVDISKVFDVADKQYKKGGRVLNIYAGTTDWAFYEKIADCMRPRNKRKDKDPIGPERRFIEAYHLQNREVFRYEYRIKKGQTVKRDLNALLGREYKARVVLKDLFTPGLMKNIVLQSWRKIFERPENQLSLFGEKDDWTIFLHILSEARKKGATAHSMNSALVSYALATLMRNRGAKEVKNAILDFWGTDHPERLTQKIKIAHELTAELPLSNNVAFVDKALEDYQLVNLASIEKGI